MRIKLHIGNVTVQMDEHGWWHAPYPELVSVLNTLFSGPVRFGNYSPDWQLSLAKRAAKWFGGKLEYKKLDYVFDRVY